MSFFNRISQTIRPGNININRLGTTRYMNNNSYKEPLYDDLSNYFAFLNGLLSLTIAYNSYQAVQILRKNSDHHRNKELDITDLADKSDILDIREDIEDTRQMIIKRLEK